MPENGLPGKLHLKALFQAKGVTTLENGAEVETFVFRFTSDVVDRQGEIVTLDGWEFDNYLANPVVVDSHDYSSIANIVGRTVKLERQDDGHYAHIVFNGTPKGVLARQLVEAGDLRATSVGFRPIEVEIPERAMEGRERAGASGDRSKITINQESDPATAPRHTLKELLEISTVVVPANQEALRTRGAGSGSAAAKGQAPVAVTGIWLRSGSGDDDTAEVLAEVDGEWRLVIRERYALADQVLISHIVEPLGIREAVRLGQEAADEAKAARKAGRVLSAANEQRIRSAVATLGEVLESLGPSGGSESDDDGKGQGRTEPAAEFIQVAQDTWDALRTWGQVAPATTAAS